MNWFHNTDTRTDVCASRTRKQILEWARQHCRTDGHTSRITSKARFQHKLNGNFFDLMSLQKKHFHFFDINMSDSTVVDRQLRNVEPRRQIWCTSHFDRANMIQPDQKGGPTCRQPTGEHFDLSKWKFRRHFCWPLSRNCMWKFSFRRIELFAEKWRWNFPRAAAARKFHRYNGDGSEMSNLIKLSEFNVFFTSCKTFVEI